MYFPFINYTNTYLKKNGLIKLNHLLTSKLITMKEFLSFKKRLFWRPQKTYHIGEKDHSDMVDEHADACNELELIAAQRPRIERTAHRVSG